jgi:peptidoglycan lytic transglycosylase
LCPVVSLAQKKPHRAHSAHPAVKRAPVAPSARAVERLEKLSRLLKEKNSSWAYGALREIAGRKSSGALAPRAALALGFYDYSKGHYPAAAAWLERAKKDPLLGDYALYWSAENDLARNQNAAALAELKQLRHDFPDSVITEQALQSLGDAAFALQQPSELVSALDAYALTTQNPALLLLRGEAHEKAGQLLDAAADYRAVYTRFARSDQASEAATKLDFLRSGPGGAPIPPLPLAQRFAHAAILYNSGEWSDARAEYSAILPQLSGADAERAELRILQCGVALGADPAEMIALHLSDPDVTAERSYLLARYYRGVQQEGPMNSAVEAAVSSAPSSQWASNALFLAGNYYWVQLERDQAAGYYKRLEEQFPASPDASTAQWRVAWTAFLKRAPEARELLQEHLRRFPGSDYTPDALYWLGRLAEDAGTPGLARSYYEKLLDRYSQTYFAGLALTRVRALGPGSKEIADVIATIPPLPVTQKLGDDIPASAAKWQARADALASIAFDSSAALELHAAYLATGEPRLLLESAQEAVASGHCGAAIVAVRQIYPHLEAYSLTDVPRPVWLAAYALPFQTTIRRWSAHFRLDPMLVAGLIHQESAFEPKARSVSNAMGLMQLIPPTARRLARENRIRYSHARLVDPEYNIRLGTSYLSDLHKQFDSVEEVLAAYNAGENRVTSWTDGQNYREPAEFVESIPFTETRQYVQIVARNASIYRRLYGVDDDSRRPRTRNGN